MQESSIQILVERLSAHVRRVRQDAAHEVATLAEEDPASLAPFAEELIDGLSRPEAQTRWELLNALALIAGVDPAAVEGAIDEAETALFDEDSSMVRLAAFRFLAREGASSPELSLKVWPLIDEAVQCYHGDLEFRDMLAALLEFVQGDIDPKVREEVAERVAFDAENSSMSFIKAYSAQIVEAAKA